MEVQNILYPNSKPFATPTYYTPFYTPPYITPFTYQCWSELAPLTTDDAYQMQHLRFPTPPITPPKGNITTDVTPSAAAAAATSPKFRAAATTRTQSVIMKVGQGQSSPQHVPAELYTMETHNNKSNSGSISSSESSCSPSTDFVCNWLNCGLCFESLESLAQHVTHLHAVASLTDGLYYCRWSGCMRSERGFNARYKMLVHVRTHTKEKPHQCHMCEKSFSRAENLKIHIRSHSGEKPYKCTFDGCLKAYSNSSDRFKHTRTHSMEKPYMCKVPGCHKRYTDPSSLRKHVKTFKHGEQLINTETMPISDEINTADHMSSIDADANNTLYERCANERDSYFGACQAKQYYMEMNDDVEHMNYATTNYWLASPQTSSVNCTTNAPSYLSQADYSMDIDLETPLDLRIKRS